MKKRFLASLVFGLAFSVTLLTIWGVFCWGSTLNKISPTMAILFIVGWLFIEFWNKVCVERIKDLIIWILE